MPKAVKILNSSGGRIQVRDDNGEVFSTDVTNVIKPLHTTSLASVEDMITLGELQEYTILRNLHIRYNQQLIYVRYSFLTLYNLIEERPRKTLVLKIMTSYSLFSSN